MTEEEKKKDKVTFIWIIVVFSIILVSLVIVFTLGTPYLPLLGFVIEPQKGPSFLGQKIDISVL